MTTADLARRSALTRAADEDDAHDDALALAEDGADRLVHDLEQLAASPGVTPESAAHLADTYTALVALAAIESAQPILSGVARRAHGGLSASEARRLTRITRREVAEHREERRRERDGPPAGRAGGAE